MKVTTELGKGIEQIILKAEEMIELFLQIIMKAD